MNTLTKKLIAKEFYLNRWFIVGTVVSGLAAIAIAGTNKMGFNVGMLIWMTAIIALGLMLALHGLVNERKERSLLFTLSLPLSTGDYLRVKLIGLLACFGVPWLILTAGVFALVLLHPGVPDGLLPMAVLMCGYLLANYSVVLGGALSTSSEGAMTGLIITTNMAVTLFIFVIGAIPSIHSHLGDPAPTWSPAFWTVLLCEAVVFVAALVIPYSLADRRRDVL